MGYRRMSLPLSKCQDECGLHPTFTFLIEVGEVPPPRPGLIPIFANTVGSVEASGIFRACVTESCREHKEPLIHLFTHLLRNVQEAPRIPRLWSKECPPGNSSVGILFAAIPQLNIHAHSAKTSSPPLPPTPLF